MSGSPSDSVRVRVDLGPQAVSARLREASRRSDLSPGARLDAKLDLSPAGISRRLRLVSELNATCAWLASLPVVPRTGNGSLADEP